MPAGYFDNFPFIEYSLNQNPKPGESDVVQDIFRRTAPVANLLKNKQLFYTHQVTEGETPEGVADNFYGSTRYHWVVNLLNNITDPLLDWPKGYANLVLFINDKYGSVANASSTIHHFTLTESKVDSLGNSSVRTFVVDKTRYDNSSNVTPVVVTFGNGVIVTTSVTRASVDNYTYETSLNESKRTILLLKDTYLSQVVSELETLLAS
jgi:molybdopterin-binding protein